MKLTAISNGNVITVPVRDVDRYKNWTDLDRCDSARSETRHRSLENFRSKRQGVPHSRKSER
jgi:hypothetical protein